jgi:hypothetical protein
LFAVRSALGAEGDEDYFPIYSCIKPPVRMIGEVLRLVREGARKKGMEIHPHMIVSILKGLRCFWERKLSPIQKQALTRAEQIFREGGSIVDVLVGVPDVNAFPGKIFDDSPVCFRVNELLEMVEATMGIPAYYRTTGEYFDEAERRNPLLRGLYDGTIQIENIPAKGKAVSSARKPAGPKDLCPCGSGIAHKDCCRGES